MRIRPEQMTAARATIRRLKRIAEEDRRERERLAKLELTLRKHAAGLCTFGDSDGTCIDMGAIAACACGPCFARLLLRDYDQEQSHGE